MGKDRNIAQGEVEEWMDGGVGRRLHCGAGLYLCRNANARFSWAVIWMKDGKRREHGLGAYGPKMQLREARWHSVNLGSRMPQGKDDPIEERKVLRKEAVAQRITFGEVAEIYVRDIGSRRWKQKRQRDDFERVVQVYCKDLLKMRIGEVSVADVKKVLTPWIDTRPTMVASVASVIRRVVDTAIANEWRPQALGNPAASEVLSKVVVVKKKGGHWASMPWEDAPKFYQGLVALETQLMGLEGRSTRNARNKALRIAALRLLMLTALRKMELLGLRWDEVDLATGVMKIAGSRMKAGKEHVVPLCDEAKRLLQGLWDACGGKGVFVFPAPRKGVNKRNAGCLDANSFIGLLPQGSSAHGWRATFRTWCEDTDKDTALAEHALAHALTDGVQKAYRRSTAIERRRELMNEWGQYLKS